VCVYIHIFTRIDISATTEEEMAERQERTDIHF